MSAESKNGYTTFSKKVRDIKVRKDELRARDYPVTETKALVHEYLGEIPTLPAGSKIITAPSTTGTNIIPLLIAKKLQESNPDTEVVGNVARAQHITKSANKGGMGKIREPVELELLDTRKLEGEKNIFLVDDVVTTGETTDHLREKLAAKGIFVAGVISMGQSETRKVSITDMMRISGKLGEPDMSEQVVTSLDGRLKHKANYLERSINDENRNELRDYFNRESQRLSQLDPGARKYIQSADSMATRLQLGQGRKTGLAQRR